MYTTSNSIPIEVFNFFGQSELDTWQLKNSFEEAGWARYSEWLVNELPFCLQRIKDLSEIFPFWQRKSKNGRPSVSEKVLFIAFLVKEFFRATFRQTEAILRIFKGFFQIQTIPDHTTLSRKNRMKRWTKIWKRFHQFVLKLLPKRKNIIATDATGFSGRKRSWRETPYNVRANQDWVKLHASIEIDTFFILSYELTKSNVHESKMFENVWQSLPDNIEPSKSLADSAYTNEKNISTAKKYGATPYHGIKKNAIYKHKPETNYEKMVNFATHWPNRFKNTYGKRNHAESAFSSLSTRFEYRLKCRTKTARKNEVQTKINAHNIRTLAQPMFLMQN